MSRLQEFQVETVESASRTSAEWVREVEHTWDGRDAARSRTLLSSTPDLSTNPQSVAHHSTTQHWLNAPLPEHVGAQLPNELNSVRAQSSALCASGAPYGGTISGLCIESFSFGAPSLQRMLGVGCGWRFVGVVAKPSASCLRMKWRHHHHDPLRTEWCNTCYKHYTAHATSWERGK